MRIPSKTSAGQTSVRLALAMAIALMAGTGLLAAISGAIYTSKGDGTTVDQNLYDSKPDVYLNGGPQNQNGSGLPDGTYYFQVTDPSGATLLSTDLAICRQLTVVGGKVAGATGPCPHANGTPNSSNGSTPVQLIPFDDTPNNGGEYKVWLIPVGAATIGVDGITLNFTNNNTKTDNFKVKESIPPPCEGDECPCEGEDCELNTYSISGLKFYDANLNGIYEPGLGEVGIQGWKIELGDSGGPLSNTTTDGPPTPGDYEFLNLLEGDYQVCEVIPELAPTWIPTTATNLFVSVGPDSTDNDFGNVCLGPGGGKTLGFWSNKNGAKVFANIGGLTILNPYYLRNGAGTKVTPLASYTAFRTWILSATATNMAYMLSAQFAAMKLNVGAGYVDDGAFVLAGACGNTGPGNTFITIADLLTAAADQIHDHGLTTAASDPTNRAIQECLKNALDDANNNKNFVQSSPCDVNYSGLEPSCLQ